MFLTHFVKDNVNFFDTTLHLQKYYEVLLLEYQIDRSFKNGHSIKMFYSQEILT